LVGEASTIKPVAIIAVQIAMAWALVGQDIAASAQLLPGPAGPAAVDSRARASLRMAKYEA
jgi:hypothetical protein